MEEIGIITFLLIIANGIVTYKGLKDFIHIAQVRDYNILIEMLKSFSEHGPPMNMLYITADDHYGYISVGPTPIRRHPHMGMYVKDGSNA